MNSSAPGVVQFHEQYVGLRLAGFPHQRAFLRTLAREPLDGSAERDAYEEIFGVEHDRPIPEAIRRVVLLIKGARCGGTLLCSNFSLFRALTADLSDRRVGERVFVGFTGADVRHAREAIAQVGTTLDRMPAFASMVVSRSTERIEIRRPDGHVIVFQCLPATPSAPRGRWFLAVIVTEADYLGASDGAAPAEEVVRAYAARLVRGGVLLAETTPWLENGHWHRTYLANFGKPTSTLVCRAPTLVFYSTPETRALVEAETLRDEVNAAREYNCQWQAPGSAFFDSAAIASSVDMARTLILPPRLGARVGVGLDLAFKGDASACVVVMARPDNGLIDVARVELVKPAKGAPLIPSTVITSFGEIARSYGAGVVGCDSHYAEAAREILGRVNISITHVGTSAESKAAAYGAVRELVHQGRLRLPPSGPLRDELRAVTVRHIAGGGVKIESPRRPGAHGDATSALVAACNSLARGVSASAMHESFVDINARLQKAGVRWGTSGF